MTIVESWAKIEKHVAGGMDADRSLPSGATLEDLTNAESRFGFTLPSDLRTSLTLHNGSGSIWLTKYGPLLPIDRIVYNWDMLTDLWWDENPEHSPPRGPTPDAIQGPIRSCWWHRLWIPFAWNLCGDHLCVDLAPADRGVIGQIITWYHNTGPEKVIANGYSEFLDHIRTETFLLVEFEEVLVPEQRHLIKTVLDVSLREVGVGRVTGSETFSVSQESGICANIEVIVNELEAGVRIIRHKLQELDVPSGTWIHWWEPEECSAEVWFHEPPTWGW